MGFDLIIASRKFDTALKSYSHYSVQTITSQTKTLYPTNQFCSPIVSAKKSRHLPFSKENIILDDKLSFLLTLPDNQQQLKLTVF